MCDTRFSVGVIGARGYVGAELLKLIGAHPRLSLAYAASRSKVGEAVEHASGEVYLDSDIDSITQVHADAVVLAVPDGAARAYAKRFGDDTVVLDLSSDHRFDDAWVYGLSELHQDRIKGTRRISNPGCYATALQLAAHPLLGHIDGPIHAFGVSGYSGAGTTPSARNDPEQLTDGVTPYKLVDHTHEREATRHLRHPVRFTPHVAPYFRGITLTLHATAAAPMQSEELESLYQDAYSASEIVEVVLEGVPRVQDVAGLHSAQIGGITVGDDGVSIAAVCVLDNLLLGASTQALQNLNLALGIPKDSGLVMEAVS